MGPLKDAIFAWGFSKPALITCRLRREGITLGHLMMLEEEDLGRIFCEKGDTHLLIEMRYCLKELRAGGMPYIRDDLAKYENETSRKIFGSGQDYSPPPNAFAAPRGASECDCAQGYTCVYRS